MDAQTEARQKYQEEQQTQEIGSNFFFVFVILIVFIGLTVYLTSQSQAIKKG